MQLALQNHKGEIIESNSLSLHAQDTLILEIQDKKLYDQFSQIGFGNVAKQFAQYIKNNNVVIVPPGMVLKVLRKEST